MSTQSRAGSMMRRVEEDANLQQATLLLVVSNRYNQPRLCVLDVDFAANSFRIARTFELSLAQPGDHVREARVRRFGGLLNLSFAPLVNRAILRTAEPTRFLVVVGDSMGPAAFFFDLTTGTVEAIRHGEPLARGRFVGFQFFENQLVCVEQIVRLDAPRRLAVRVVLADLETGNTRLIPAERWFFAATDWRIESMCVKDDCLYVLAKKPHSEEAIRAFGVRLPDGFWKAVKCGQFAPFAFEHAVSAFQADFWTVHCRRTAIVGGHSAPEFHSFRIPMARLESLLWRSWFSLLNGPSIRAVVPNAFVSRLLSRTGLYTDRVAFEPPRTFIIREDVDLAEAARPAAAVGQNRFQTGGEAAEQADLEAAIQQSPLPSTGETSQTSAKKEAEQINADGDHAMDFSDPENEAMDDEMADA
ncbi:hypothetical protein M3Y99_00911000 [Aphelenchoides fujianensis]|nr:hypothetical protein M3Y99_00911000 [Aphelenchoides fujianensis]